MMSPPDTESWDEKIAPLIAVLVFKLLGLG